MGTLASPLPPTPILNTPQGSCAMIPFLFLLSFLNPSESCTRTPSVPMPNPPTCSALCAQSLISVPAPPMLDMTSPSGSCAVRTLTCLATLPPTATITYNGGAGSVSASSSVQLVVTCNGAGTAWLYMGIPITSVTCT